MIEPSPSPTVTPAANSSSGTRPEFAERVNQILNDPDLEELAAKLALNGFSLEHGLIQLETAKQAKLNALEEECRSRKAVLKKWIDDSVLSIDAIRAQISQIEEEREKARQSKFNIDVAIRMVHLKKATIRLEIRVRQLEAEKEFFTQESNNLAQKEAAIRQKMVKDKQEELEYAKHLHGSLLDIWKIDETELTRRADVLKGEYNQLESALVPIAQKISELRGVGLTRTTAGFLIWVGYTAFAGVGGLIGVLLQQRQSDPKSADLIGNMIRGVAAFFGLLPGATFAWSSFLRFLMFTGIVLLFTVGITLACDVMLRQIHPRWRRSSFERQPQKRPSHATGWRELTAVFLSGYDRLSLFTGQITRRDYLQLLAVTPYLSIAALVVFLISALGVTLPSSSGGAGLSAGATLTSASLGAVFTLISTSASLLYATKIIEPRWQKVARSEAGGLSRFSFFWAGWEFALLLLFMITVVLFLTFLPVADRYNYWAWGLAALFLTCGSIGLAYGLICRGVFRDYDVVIRKRQEYALKIEDLVLKPTLNDIFEATDNEELTNSAEHYRKAGEYLDGLRIEHEMMGLFSDYDTGYDGDFSSFWFKEGDRAGQKRDQSSDIPYRPGRRLARLIRRLGWRRRIVETPFSWLRTDPGGIEMLKAHDDEIAGYDRQRKDIDNQLIELERQRNMAETSLGATTKELREYETRFWTAEAECARKSADCNLEALRQQNLFTVAYLTGKTVYEFLQLKPDNELSLGV